MSTPLNDSLVPSAATRSSDRTGAPDTRLHGRKLNLARVVWVAVVTLLVALFLAMLPAYYTLLQTVCTGAPCGLGQPSLDSAQAIQKLGFSVGTYATFTLALTLASAFLCFTLSAVIFWRKSDDWMALLGALGVVALGTVNVSSVLQTSHSTWQALAIVMNVFGYGVFFLVCSLFPNGRFVPRWTRWLLPCWVALGMVFLIFRDVSFAYLVQNLVWLAVVILLVTALFYRYHYASSPLQRQQTKWVISGLCVAGIISVGLIVPTLLFSSLGQAGSLYQLILQPAEIVVVLIIPISFGLAILRYRLWDIDLIIRRTLVYGALTVILTGVYVGLVIGLQALLRGIINQGSGVAIVISTLAIAALFQPLRKRIQAIIDRRFYRSKYDAAKTVAAFSATLRQEVDLDQLREHLLAVVQETMQPAHVSLWLRPPQRYTEEPRRLEKPHTMEEGY
jgi:hypothetical protein